MTNAINEKTMTVLFSTREARDVAQSLLEERVGMRAVIVAPKELATDDWVNWVTRNCRDWTVRYLYEHTLDKPIEILALALELGVDAKYFRIDRGQLGNPEVSLMARGVPARVAARRSKQLAFTRQLKEIRLSNDYGSSGLWNQEGKMLSCDLLDAPFPLVRRIAAWQRDFDDTVTPPDEGSDEWWERHAEEAIQIAQALEAAVGSQVAVKLYHQDSWMTVDQIDRTKGGGS